MTLYEKALKIAAEAHAGQVRKHDGSPYIVHPTIVARILEAYGFDEEVVAAGLVHDVLEDSETSEDNLRAVLGDRVVDAVVAVSEDKTLPWEERKAAYAQAVAASSEDTRAVSLADKIHNAQNLTEHYGVVGPKIWENFNRGKEKKIWFERLVLSSLRDVWQHPLLDVYEELLEKMERLPD